MIFYVCNKEIWWYRKSTWYEQRWRLHKKVLWILMRHAVKVIIFERKKMIPLTNEQHSKICYICTNKVEDNYIDKKNIADLEIVVIILVNTVVLHVVYFIWNIVYIKKVMWLFKTDQTMIKLSNWQIELSFYRKRARKRVWRRI